jgi:hypothetical protein
MEAKVSSTVEELSKKQAKLLGAGKQLNKDKEM